jgi:hypothetical protein
MARISTYNIDPNVTGEDKIIGTDANGLLTKNFRVASVADYFNASGAISVAGQNNFIFQTDLSDGRLPGTISFTAGGGHLTPFNALTTVKFSKFSAPGSNIINYLLTLVGRTVALVQTNNHNSFGIYKLNSFVEDVLEPGFYNASFSLVESNGAILNETIYGFAIYPDIVDLSGVELLSNKQNSLAVDGSGVKYPTVDAVNATLNTLGLQKVTDNGNTTTNTILLTPAFDTPGLIVNATGGDDGNGIRVNSTDTDAVVAYSVSSTAVNATSEGGVAGAFHSFNNTAGWFLANIGRPIQTFGNGISQVELNNGATSKGLVINSGASSSGDVITHDKNGLINLKITQAGNITANSFIKLGGLSTQYLKADGSVSTLTNPVTGTGATNVIPKFTGASTLGDSSLSDDGTFVTSTIDLKINGVTVGRGGGSITSNTALGSTALIANTSGTSNVAVGREALSKNTTGLDNTAVGVRALLNNTLGQANTAIGKNNMQFNVSGTKNTSIGYESLNQNSSGFNNTALGYQALYFTSTASANLGSGYKALYSNTTGSNNVAVGSESLSNTSAAIQNTSIGAQALVGMLTGDKNVAVGFNAGRYIGSISTNTSSSNSIFIGFQTKPLLTGQSNQIVIGYDTTGNGTNTTTIGNFNVLQTYIRGEVIVGGATPTGSSKLKVDGSIRVQDDTAGASSTNVGALRYRKTGNNSYVEMCMQTAATTYAWTVIVEQNW